MNEMKISQLARGATDKIEMSQEYVTAVEQAMQSAINEGCKPLVEAADALVKRMEEVHNSPEYQGVWTCYMIHGGDYTNGPKYEQALARLRFTVEAHRKEHGE